MTTVAFIPARGGSQRIPCKNLALVGARSLLHRAINVAFDVPCIRVVVSTNDAEIRCRALRVEIHDRPAELADAHAQIEDAIAHWLATAGLADDDVIVLLQPTTPFRRAATVRRCIELVQSGACESACTALMYTRNTGRVRGLYDAKRQRDVGQRVLWDRPVATRPRSQDAGQKAMEDGCCWAFTVRHFRATKNRMTDRSTALVPCSELEALEIDYPSELEKARALAPHVDRLLAMEDVELSARTTEKLVEHRIRSLEREVVINVHPPTVSRFDDPQDPEAVVERTMRYVRALLAPVIAIARVMPNGQATIDKALATILPETERQYRALVFSEKLDANARARGEVLLAKLRTDIEAYAREEARKPEDA
jgi:CMP-N-acetylneuraminic acid synthetase